MQEYPFSWNSYLSLLFQLPIPLSKDHSPENRDRVLVAGRMDYRTALKLQYLLASNHKNPSLCEKTNNTLVLIEHDPVYTVGIRDKSYSHEDEKKLKALGAEFHRTNRGGLITFHGPGQLVVYPIINLKEFKPSMRWYVSQLENTVIALCKKYDITASTSPHTGVWVEDRKICAIGIHGSRFVTTHGIALNCSTNLEWFSHIVPCGIEGKEVTSLTNERNELISIENAIPIFLSCFSEQFN
ncbi:Putative lipoyltransferase 2, mitochondrial, partial [Gryllus bimaculatus]